MTDAGSGRDAEEVSMSAPMRERRPPRRQPRRLQVVRVPTPRVPTEEGLPDQSGNEPAVVAEEVTAGSQADGATPGSATAATKSKTAATKSKTAAVRAEPDGRRWAPANRLALALAVVLVAALTVAGVFGHRWYQQQQLESARQGALAAAKQTAVDFVSISASSVDRDLQRISSGAAGTFADEFKRGMPQVRTAVVENNVESRGTVLRAGVVSGDLDSAVVLVAVDATVKNARAPEGRLSHYRIQMDLTRDDDSDRWLVSRLQFVG